jgi:uncharacterized membrane protein
MFSNFQIGFQYPWILLLLLVIPWIWWSSRSSLAGLGPARQWIALVLRSLVLSMVILALAGIQWIWVSDRQTVIFLLDQSDSIPLPKRQLMLRYAIESVKKHRRENRLDRAGLILFGREASIEIPPLDENLPPLSKPESNFGKPDATNLEGALKLAAATFLEDSAKRIVVLTDGNQTLGSAETAAKRLSESGIGIDVIPVRLDSNSEVLVEKIDIPGFVRQGQTVDARVVINRFQAAEQPPKEIAGRLRVVRRIGNQSEVLADAAYTLDRDVNVIPIPHKIEQTAGYTYEAEFIADNQQEDTIPQNNRATAFTYARGKARVMLIEDANNIGNYNELIDALARNDIEVDVRNTSNLFSSLVELQSYDSVILAGVPRTSGDSMDQLASITEEQVEMMVKSSQQFGMGILMLGGPEAFGAGGWTNTKLEEAMPVNFAVKNPKLNAVGALAMVMHASEMAEGNHWQKVIGKSALEALGPEDYCGVIQYDMTMDSWLWGSPNQGLIKVQGNKNMMRSRLSRMVPGDMPDFDSSLKLAITSLATVPAALKHMIVISDGDPTPASQAVLGSFTKNKVKISTVAVGAHGTVGTTELKRIATVTGGNYYIVNNSSALPKIFMREARRVTRPLVFEPVGGVPPIRQLPNHEILSGIPDELPNLRGFVLTEKKDSPLVEVPLLGAKPDDPQNASLLATWNYGLGRTAVFTSDGGKRWAGDWIGSPYYDQFFSQLVRWTMKPQSDSANYSLATQVKEGRVQIVVNATDKNDRTLNFLEMSATAIGPNLEPISLPLKQQAPGRYVGEFAPEQAGSYMVSINPGAGKPVLTTGVTVPFSDEYRIRQANSRLIEQIASNRPVGGESGKVLPDLAQENLEDLLGVDTFRQGIPPAKSLKDVWPIVVLIGAALFFADVFVRRVAVDLGWPLRKLALLLSRRNLSTTDELRQQTLDRLRSSKKTIVEDLGKQKTAATLEGNSPEVGLNSSRSPGNAQKEPVSSSSSFGDASSDTGRIKQDSARNVPDRSPKAQDSESENYTSRLLEAKRKAQKKNP